MHFDGQDWDGKEQLREGMRCVKLLVKCNVLVQVGADLILEHHGSISLA